MVFSFVVGVDVDVAAVWLPIVASMCDRFCLLYGGVVVSSSIACLAFVFLIWTMCSSSILFLGVCCWWVVVVLRMDHLSRWTCCHVWWDLLLLGLVQQVLLLLLFYLGCPLAGQSLDMCVDFVALSGCCCLHSLCPQWPAMVVVANSHCLPSVDLLCILSSISFSPFSGRCCCSL